MEENPSALCSYNQLMLHLAEYHWRTFHTAGWVGQQFTTMCHFITVIRNHKKHVEVSWARIGQSLKQIAIVNCDSVSRVNPHVHWAVAANSLVVNWQVCVKLYICFSLSSEFA